MQIARMQYRVQCAHCTHIIRFICASIGHLSANEMNIDLKNEMKILQKQKEVNSLSPSYHRPYW